MKIEEFLFNTNLLRKCFKAAQNEAAPRDEHAARRIRGKNQVCGLA
jgi:hypothetical protein